MPANADSASDSPAYIQQAIVAISITAGMANASMTAFAPFAVSVHTMTFCPTLKREALSHLTSIIFSLLSDEAQY